MEDKTIVNSYSRIGAKRSQQESRLAISPTLFVALLEMVDLLLRIPWVMGKPWNSHHAGSSCLFLCLFHSDILNLVLNLIWWGSDHFLYPLEQKCLYSWRSCSSWRPSCCFRHPRLGWRVPHPQQCIPAHPALALCCLTLAFVSQGEPEGWIKRSSPFGSWPGTSL